MTGTSPADRTEAEGRKPRVRVEEGEAGEWHTWRAVPVTADETIEF